MENQDLVCRALYEFNLTQLSIVAALEDMTALVGKISYLSPEVVDSLNRHLETVGRNCDRSCEAMYALVTLKAEMPD